MFYVFFAAANHSSKHLWKKLLKKIVSHNEKYHSNKLRGKDILSILSIEENIFDIEDSDDIKQNISVWNTSKPITKSVNVIRNKTSDKISTSFVNNTIRISKISRTTQIGLKNLTAAHEKRIKNDTNSTNKTAQEMNSTSEPENLNLLGDFNNLSKRSKKILGVWMKVQINIQFTTTSTAAPYSRWFVYDEYYINGSIISFYNDTYFLLNGSIYNQTSRIYETHHAWLYMMLLIELLALIFISCTLFFSACCLKCLDLN